MFYVPMAPSDYGLIIKSPMDPDLDYTQQVITSAKFPSTNFQHQIALPQSIFKNYNRIHSLLTYLSKMAVT